MEYRLWYSESFTRILDKDHRPDLTCLLQDVSPRSQSSSWRQMGFVSAGSVLEQLAQSTSHPRWSYKKQKHLTTCASSQTQQGFSSTAKTQLEF